MIYTVTFNPSLDYIVSVKDFQMGMTNRTDSELMLPGGKGTNVSIVLKNLGMESVALGFAAGFVGDEIVNALKKTGVLVDFIKLPQGNSRINVKLTSVDGTEINGQGPEIGSKELEQLYKKLDELTKEDILVLAGSIPASMPDDIYEKIMERLQTKGVTVVVDATKDLLLNVLKYKPFLIKPNHHELGEIFGVTLQEKEEVIPYARKLQEMGAVNVMVSMGGKGGVFLAQDGRVYGADTLNRPVVNSVGAGDSTVAGFLAGWLTAKEYEEAFRMAMATGQASAYSDQLATKENVEEIFSQLSIEKLAE